MYFLVISPTAVSKRRLSLKHFIQKNAEFPEVDLRPIALLFDDFRREILRSACKSFSKLIDSDLLRQSKISKFNVPIRTNQNVLRLEISVDNPFGV